MLYQLSYTRTNLQSIRGDGGQATNDNDWV
jgi:hypothetical protein